MKFTAEENRQLTEVYRRLNYFNQNNLDERLLMLAFPNEVKTLKQKGILRPSSTETVRVQNWYTLTEKGKELFKSHSQENRMSHDKALALFEGKKTLNFNISLTV